MRHDPALAGAGGPLDLMLKRAPSISADSDDGSIKILQRSLDAEIAAALDDFDASSLPELRLCGSAAVILAELSHGLTGASAMPHWLREWLVSDIAFLMRMFAEHSGATAFAVRFEAISGTMCPRFHADHVRFRLVTTYRGSGTEWVTSDGSVFVRDGQAAKRSIVRQLDRGWIAIMRGRKAETENSRPLLHRSPATDPGTPPRLFLAIDDADDRVARHGIAVERSRGHAAPCPGWRRCIL